MTLGDVTPLAQFEPELQGGTDARASAEALALGAGSDLEKQKAIKEDARFQAFRNHFNTALIIVFWAVMVCITTGVLIFSWHVLAPACWHFLAEDKLDKLQTILAAALLSSALSTYANRQIS